MSAEVRVRRLSTREREVASVTWTTPYRDGMGNEHWTERQWYAQIGGVKCQLEWRRNSAGDTPATGWYLFTYSDEINVFGEYVGRLFGPAMLRAKRVVERRLAPQDDLPVDDERHEQFGCLTADDIAEERLKSRDYESWARL